MSDRATAVCASRVCEVCGVTIDHLRPQARVCGGACRARRSRGHQWVPPGNCDECGTELPRQSRGDRRYCGTGCKVKAWRKSEAEKARKPSVCTCGGSLVERDADGVWVCLLCGKAKA